MLKQMAVATLAASAAAILVQLPLFLAYMALPALLGGASIRELAGPLAFGLFWVALIAAVVVIVIGLPLFLVLSHNNLASARNVAVAGLVVACLGSSIFIWPARGSGWSYSATTFFGYRDLVIDGIPTIWGWINYAKDVATFGLHGLVGALVFVYVWRRLTGAQYAS